MADFKELVKENPAATAGIAVAALIALVILLVRPVRNGAIKFGATLYLQLSFWGSHTICLILQVLVLIIFSWWLPKRYCTTLFGMCQQITILFIMVLNPFWYVKVHKRSKLGIPKGAVVVCNHLSYVDSWIVASAIFPVPPKFVAMHSLFKMPLFGQVMKLSGHIPVKFQKKEDGRWGVSNGDEVTARGRQYLEWGNRLVVFPEGSLSRTGELLEFKMGFFRLAHEMNRPVVPVACWGNHKMFPPGNQWALADFARVYCQIGDPVMPSDFETPELLRDYVVNSVKEMKENLPSYDKAAVARAVAEAEAKKSSAVTPAAGGPPADDVPEF
mmetsp:Transcript_17107/g.54393  ORF Transcript_17107/g.54393 Transcript_17107/m.54393 type:complete len:329 (+) Transcript_17107:324-1310(+)